MYEGTLIDLAEKKRSAWDVIMDAVLQPPVKQYEAILKSPTGEDLTVTFAAHASNLPEVGKSYVFDEYKRFQTH